MNFIIEVVVTGRFHCIYIYIYIYGIHQYLFINNIERYVGIANKVKQDGKYNTMNLVITITELICKATTVIRPDHFLNDIYVDKYIYHRVVLNVVAVTGTLY